MPPRYTFRSRWVFREDAATVFDLLVAIEEYPAWWREVRSIRKVDEQTVAARVRSSLPYDLTFTVEQVTVDPARGVLEAALEGDLEGTTRWTIEREGGKTVCTFDEDVVTNKRLMNILAPIARPLFRANHWVMMRRGYRGARRALRDAGGFSRATRR